MSRPRPAPLSMTMTSRHCMRHRCPWKVTGVPGHLFPPTLWLCRMPGVRLPTTAPCGCGMEGRDFWNRAHLLGRNGVHSLGLLWLPFLSRGLLLALPTHLQGLKGIFGNRMKGRRDERSSAGQLLLEVTDLQTGRLVFPV